KVPNDCLCACLDRWTVRLRRHAWRRTPIVTKREQERAFSNNIAWKSKEICRSCALNEIVLLANDAGTIQIWSYWRRSNQDSTAYYGISDEKRYLAVKSIGYIPTDVCRVSQNRGIDDCRRGYITRCI